MARKSKQKGRGPAPKPAQAKGPSKAASAASGGGDDARDDGAPGAGASVAQAADAPVADAVVAQAHDDAAVQAHHAHQDAVDAVDDADGSGQTLADGVDDAGAIDARAGERDPGAGEPRRFDAVPAPALDLGPVEVVDSGVGNPDDIRGVLIQLTRARLLLPNATIAEVLSYAEPDAIPGTPDWLLGRIRWRGWQLPLLAFSQLAGISDERGGLGSKVVVLKALSGGKTPYFAVLTQGFPRLVTVSRAALVVDESAEGLPEILTARVTLNEDDAYLPDLARVEQLIGEALSQAA